MNDLIKLKPLKIIAGIIGGFILASLIFSAGVFVGLKKAKFSYRWGENYERNFMGPRPPMGPMGFFHEMEGRDFRNPHGLAGTIVSITDNNLVVKDQDNKENTVAVTDKTIIKDRGLDLKISDLKQDQKVVIMGKPQDNGVINADLIRVFDINLNQTK